MKGVRLDKKPLEFHQNQSGAFFSPKFSSKNLPQKWVNLAFSIDQELR